MGSASERDYYISTNEFLQQGLQATHFTNTNNSDYASYV
jgi:hypothetical protein